MDSDSSGTDAALVNGLAYVLITENMVDQPFPDKYCVGYDEKPCLPARRKTVTTKPIFWAGVKTVLRRRRSGRRKLPVFRRIALLSWREKSAALNPPIFAGVGPQRHANGEIATRAISMLAILTGNVGINGGNSGAREGSYALPFERMPTLENPVETSISMFMWTDAIERGPEMTALRDGVRGKISWTCRSK